MFILSFGIPILTTMLEIEKAKFAFFGAFPPGHVMFIYSFGIPILNTMLEIESAKFVFFWRFPSLGT